MKLLISKGMAAVAIAALSCIAFDKTATAQCPPGSIPPGSPLSSYITDYPYGDNPSGTGVNSTAIPSTFLVDVTTANPFLGVGMYEAWCVDETTPLTAPNNEVDSFYGTIPGTFYAGLLYPTCDTNLNGLTELGQYATNGCPHINSYVSPQVWLEVDYILKTYNASAPGTYFYWDVQAAINTLVGSEAGYSNSYCMEVLSTPLPDGCGGYPSYNSSNANYLVTNAVYNVVTKKWAPTCGDVVAAVYVTAACNQLLIVEVPYQASPTLSAPGGILGCNPKTFPTQTTVQNSVKVTGGCCPTAPTVVATVYSTSTVNCTTTQTWLITATDSCNDNIAPIAAVYTWTIDKTLPTITIAAGAGGNLGLNPTTLPTIASVSNLVTAADGCNGTPTVTVNYSDSTTDCVVTRTFYITATDECGNTAKTTVVYTWTTTTPNTCTTTGNCSLQPCGNNGSVWCCAQINCTPNTKCTIYCQNASVTLTCANGKTYTYPVPNCQVNFSPTCRTASCSYQNSCWTTTVPTCGDNQIFCGGCGIPYQSAFANCKSICFSGTFTSDTCGVTCSCQCGASSYNCNLNNCGSVNVKCCQNVSCGYNNNDGCGTPENCKSYCQGGNSYQNNGWGGSSYTGGWSNPHSCSF